jgi:hypothetical protein
VNTQKDRHCGKENPHLTHEVSLHGASIAWCALSVRITGHVSYAETNSERHARQILKMFFRQKTRKNSRYFQ